MLKKSETHVKIQVMKNGQIPVINKIGPIRHPIEVLTVIADELESLGIEIKRHPVFISDDVVEESIDEDAIVPNSKDFEPPKSEEESLEVSEEVIVPEEESSESEETEDGEEESSEESDSAESTEDSQKKKKKKKK